MLCLMFTVVVLHFTLKYFYWFLCKIKEAMIIQTIVHLLVRQWVILNFIRPANQPLPPLPPEILHPTTSPYDIQALSRKQEMRILKPIR